MTRFEKLVHAALDRGFQPAGVRGTILAMLVDLANTATTAGLWSPTEDGDRGADGGKKDFSRGAAAHALITLEELLTME